MVAQRIQSLTLRAGCCWNYRLGIVSETRGSSLSKLPINSLIGKHWRMLFTFPVCHGTESFLFWSMGADFLSFILCPVHYAAKTKCSWYLKKVTLEQQVPSSFLLFSLLQQCSSFHNCSVGILCTLYPGDTPDLNYNEGFLCCVEAPHLPAPPQQWD